MDQVPRATGRRRAFCCWACKAVIAESFERIHRSNLVGMGVLPLQFLAGQNRESLGLTGMETYSVENVSEAIVTGKHATVRAVADDGTRRRSR